MGTRMLFLGIVLGLMVMTGSWEMARGAGEDESEVRVAPGTEVNFLSRGGGRVYSCGDCRGPGTLYHSCGGAYARR